MYNLLIADDDWIHRHEFKKQLRNYGKDFRIKDEAEDGQEALKLIAANSYDAVFTDIIMPAIDGITLLTELRKENIDLPVVLISSHSDFEYAKKGIEYGAFDYIVKPLDKEKLFTLLNKLKLHLDKQLSVKAAQSRLEKLSAEKLDFGLKKEYENIVYTLLLNGKKELDSYMDCLITQHFAVYDYDCFKLGVAFEKLIKNVEERLFQNFKFAQKLYISNHLLHESIALNNSQTNIQAKIKHELARISDFIHMLHLEQTDDIVKKLCEYALTTLHKNTTLDEVAQHLNYNSEYLGKLFKSKTGESFSQFSTKIKLEYAKKLLQTKSFKNYEVSEMVGYKKVDYLSKLFKNYTGQTPSEYKKAFK